MVDRTLFGKGIPIQREAKECNQAAGKAKKSFRSKHAAYLILFEKGVWGVMLEEDSSNFCSLVRSSSITS
jgi:hypothetical protein